MHDTDKPQFLALMTGLAEYYDKPFTPSLIAIYWEDLARYPLEMVKTAVAAHRRHPERGRFLPRAADLMPFLEGSTAGRAAEGWSKVRLAIRRYGPGPTLVFDDPLIHAVLPKMGGFALLAGKDSRDLEFLGKTFADHYAALSSLPSPPPYDGRLLGEDEIEAARWRRLVPPAVMVGDPERCAQVYQGGREVAPVPLRITSGSAPVPSTFPLPE